MTRKSIMMRINMIMTKMMLTCSDHLEELEHEGEGAPTLRGQATHLGRRRRRRRRGRRKVRWRRQHLQVESAGSEGEELLQHRPVVQGGIRLEVGRRGGVG